MLATRFDYLQDNAAKLEGMGKEKHITTESGVGCRLRGITASRTPHRTWQSRAQNPNEPENRNGGPRVMKMRTTASLSRYDDCFYCLMCAAYRKRRIEPQFFRLRHLLYYPFCSSKRVQSLICPTPVSLIQDKGGHRALSTCLRVASIHRKDDS